jgi:hypothetical protein
LQGNEIRQAIENFVGIVVHFSAPLLLTFVIFPLVVGMVAEPIVMQNFSSRYEPSVIQVSSGWANSLCMCCLCTMVRSMQPVLWM